jgi:tetratricopeptide (TPR) repeat protein
MAEKETSRPAPRPEHTRVALQQYERARQAMATGNYDYSIELLRTCCKLDPANLIYRQALRRTQKIKYGNNLRGSAMAWLTTALPRARLEKAKRSSDYLKVLEYGEVILSANPWCTRTQVEMAQAAEALGYTELAVWILEQARQKDPRDARVNRCLAGLYERMGNFAQAMILWELVSKAQPTDLEAGRKAKDLAAQHTIAVGNYEEAAQSGGRVAREAESPEDTEAAKEPWRKALEPFQKKVAADPTNPVPYLQMFSILRQAKQHEEAQRCLEEGLAATGGHFELQFALAELQTDLVRENLRLAQARRRAEPEVQKWLDLEQQLERELLRREADLFRCKADRFPNDLSHRLELGIRLYKLGQLDEAITELQAARKDPRGRVRALLYLGHCFRDRKNWALARRNYSEALQGLAAGEEELRKELLFELAQLAVREGDWNTAVEVGVELADLDFGYRDIGRQLEQWLRHKEEAAAG